MQEVTIREGENNTTIANVHGIFGPRQRIFKMDVATFRRNWKLLNEGKLIQEAFPEFSPADREFLISGANEDDWAEMFGDEDEDEDEDIDLSDDDLKDLKEQADFWGMDSLSEDEQAALE